MTDASDLPKYTLEEAAEFFKYCECVEEGHYPRHHLERMEGPGVYICDCRAVEWTSKFTGYQKFDDCGRPIPKEADDA